MLDSYAIEENTPDYFANLLERAHFRNELYRIVLHDGTEIECTPIVRTTTIGIHLEGGIYEVPLKHIKDAILLQVGDDSHFMRIAIDEARACVGEDGKITPKVGAALALDGKLVSTARRGQLKPGDHAEYTLLDILLKDRNISGSTLYTTLEPCTARNHPKVPCANRIVERRIDRVVIGILDPNPEIRGEGFWRLREAGVEVAVCSVSQMKMIEDLNREFIRMHRSDRG